MSRVSEVRNDIHEGDMRDVEGVREPAAELAQPRHARTGVRVRATQDNEREHKQDARCVVETIEGESTHMGKLWCLKDEYKNNGENQKSNFGTADATLNTVQPKPHHERG